MGAGAVSLSAPFAKLEARMNSVVFARLSNAVATFYEGRDVAGIFDAPYAHGDLGAAGFASSRPTFKLPTSEVPPRVIDWFRYFAEPLDPVEMQLSIDGVLYLCVGHEPDGNGSSVLVLEKVTA